MGRIRDFFNKFRGNKQPQMLGGGEIQQPDYEDEKDEITIYNERMEALKRTKEDLEKYAKSISEYLRAGEIYGRNIRFCEFKRELGNIRSVIDDLEEDIWKLSSEDPKLRAFLKEEENKRKEELSKDEWKKDLKFGKLETPVDEGDKKDYDMSIGNDRDDFK